MPRFGARHDLRSLRGAAKSAPKSRAAQPETTQRSGRPFVVKNQNCFLTLKFCLENLQDQRQVHMMTMALALS